MVQVNLETEHNKRLKYLVVRDKKSLSVLDMNHYQRKIIKVRQENTADINN